LEKKNAILKSEHQETLVLKSIEDWRKLVVPAYLNEPQNELNKNDLLDESFNKNVKYLSHLFLIKK
jgi:hypothetical protein